MHTMNLAAFAGRLHEMLSQPDCKVVWFLGAGCSISSGIPGAASLVKDWLPRLKERETGSRQDWRDWAKTRFSGYDADDAGRVYGEVMNELFPLPHDRQLEVERITSRREPAVGYALFSMLAAHDDYGPKANVVLTTNFDDLVADSLYLLTRSKPLVVAHESLASFARASRRRPLVVKVHGDAMLAPRNTTDETHELDAALSHRLHSLLSGCALVFCGYAGNDESVTRLLAGTSPDSFPMGIYWVGSSLPPGPLGDWLRSRSDRFHVPHQDFDELFIQLADRLQLRLPSPDRFTAMFAGWETALGHAEESAAARGETSTGTTASRLRQSLDGYRAVARAQALIDSDLDEADVAFEKAVADHPGDSLVLGSYANFLADHLKDPDRAEAMYQRALVADPYDANTLGNYAIFLADDRTEPDHDAAEAMYERALVVDPDDANTLANYALFLAENRNAPDRAEAMFDRALAAGSDDANTLTNYANFLKNGRKNPERAEAMYQRALAADPDHANTLANYAILLSQGLNDPGRAEAMYQRAIAVDQDDVNTRGNHAQLLFSRHDDARAQALVIELLNRQDLPDDLRAELLFYAAAHVSEGDYGPALRQHLVAGARSSGWEFSPNLRRLAADEDHRLEFFETLAGVITAGGELSELDAFEPWRRWGGVAE